MKNIKERQKLDRRDTPTGIPQTCGLDPGDDQMKYYNYKGLISIALTEGVCIG